MSTQIEKNKKPETEKDTKTTPAPAPSSPKEVIENEAPRSDRLATLLESETASEIDRRRQEEEAARRRLADLD